MAREMSGSIRKNKNKTNSKQPDVRGSCLIKGTEFWISGWDRDAGEWTSLTFTEKSVKEVDERGDEPF